MDVQLASNRVLEKIAELWPDGMNCCSLTEKQRQLSVESNANFGETVLHTTLNLDQLVVKTENIDISHNYGKFACCSSILFSTRLPPTFPIKSLHLYPRFYFD